MIIEHFMTELKCQKCGNIFGHQWGGYVEDIGHLLCVPCHDERMKEPEKANMP